MLPASSQTSLHHPTVPSARPSADDIWNSLKAGNERFASGKTAQHDNVAQRRKMQKGQHPHVAVLSCSDSRVPPEVVFDQGIGDLFVVRVAGNSADPMGIGSLEYAVEHLDTVVIVVLGHQRCGAVTAACSAERVPSADLDAVVKPITDSCIISKEARSTPNDLIDFAIRDHVHKTANDILAHSTVLKHAHDQGKLQMIEAYYSLDSGMVTRLR